MTVVVSDTSPIRALHHLNLSNLLPSLYGRIVVPPAVLEELKNPPPTFMPVGLIDIPFVEVSQPSDSGLVATLRISLDEGESQAIALAIQTPGVEVAH